MWRKDSDLSCAYCGDSQQRKEERGCNGPAKYKYTRGPSNKIPVEFWICPVRYIGTDVIALANAYDSAGETLPLVDRRTLPGPYLEAWDLYRMQVETLKAKVREEAAKARERG